MSKGEIRLKQGSRLPTLIGLFLMIISIAVYTFFAQGLSSDLDDKKSAITSKEAEKVTLEQRIESLQQAQSDLDLTTEVSQDKVNRKIPVGMNQDEVIVDVVNIAKRFRIDLRSLSFGRGGSSQEGVNALRVNASFEGDYTDLIDFLRGIETNGRFLRVNSISVQLARTDITGVQRATFSLSMEAFFREGV